MSKPKKTFEVVGKHITYLIYRVEAETPEQAESIVEDMTWDEADGEITEYYNTDTQEVEQ